MRSLGFGLRMMKAQRWRRMRRPFAATQAGAFASARQRRGLRWPSFVSIEFVWRKAQPSLVRQSSIRHLHVLVAPRLEWIGRLERSLERQTQVESRLLLRSLAERDWSRTIERVFHHVTAGSPYRAFAEGSARSPAAPMLEARPERDAPAASLLMRPFARDTSGSFAPPEMLLHRPRPTPPVADEAIRQTPRPGRSDESSGWEGRRQPQAVRGGEPINIRELTDHVVAALDRRAIASDERLKRR